MPERKGITVNQLIVQLFKLREAGRGDQTVFVAQDGHNWCPRLDVVKEYHTPQMGHIVLAGESWTPDAEAEDIYQVAQPVHRPVRRRRPRT